MNFKMILVETAGKVTTITLNRPSALNALNAQMQEELEAALDNFSRDDSQIVAIIAGAGDRAFCAGSDLKEIAQGGGGHYPAHGYGGISQRFDLTKPIIAAVDGVCLGGGFEVALACDLIIASDAASFGLPEPRIGGMALGGGVHRLVRQVGLKRAMGLLLTCRRIDAHEAFALGLVNDVVAKGQALAAARAWCDEILLSAPLSIFATKDAAMRGLAEPNLETAILRQSEYRSFTHWRNAADTEEGPRAFAEKRAPLWKGR